MTMEDIGPKPQSFDLETATVENDVYRDVAWTGKYLQLTLMSIPVGGDIGLEVHPETDQFLRLDMGEGRCVMGPTKDDLPFSQDVSDGWSVQVPAGTGAQVRHPVTAQRDHRTGLGAGRNRDNIPGRGRCNLGVDVGQRTVRGNDGHGYWTPRLKAS